VDELGDVFEGQTYHVEPDYDAWVDGTKPRDVLDWTGMSDYIKVASS
jgi:hypothetical protein